jgi:hypothetical protein
MVFGESGETPYVPLTCVFVEPMTVEPMTGIEPAYSAWEAISTPERLFGNAW